MGNEEKYKKALEIATSILEDDNMAFAHGVVLQLFPELAEDEGERIRKEIIGFLDDVYNRGINANFDRWAKCDCAKWIKWIQSKDNEEWTKEDAMMIEETLYFINEFQKSDRCLDEGDMQNSVTCEDWLKSLQNKTAPKSRFHFSVGKLREGLNEAANEWDSKASFSPLYMEMINGKPNGVKQDVISHGDSFKAGVEWVINKLITL